jgi:hypothetical protein
LASYFGRFQYKLMDRYLLTGTIRRDGSSNFGKTIVGELFQPLVFGFFLKKISSLIKGIDLLKLRGGWGRLGNQNVPLNNQAYSSGLSSYLGGSTL